MGCRAFDQDPSAIRAHLMDRDAIDTFIQDDHIGFMIDTYNDKRRGYQFRVNPLGVQADAIVHREQDGVRGLVLGRDRGRRRGRHRPPTGFVVEVALPFNQMRFPRGRRDRRHGASRSFRS